VKSLPVRLENLEAWVKAHRERQEGRRRTLQVIRVDTLESRQAMRKERKGHDRSSKPYRSH